MNILVGFWRPTIGRILYNNDNVFRHRNQFKQIFGFATQAGSVYPTLTIEENMAYFGRLYNMRSQDIKKRTEILLDLVELTGANNVIAEELSTGMQRRLDIACALIHNPKMLLLDEPTEDLDPVLRKELLGLLKKINAMGTTVIMTSHMLNEIETVCDEIAILHNGYIVEAGAPMAIKDKYSKNQEIHISSDPGKYELIAKKLNADGIHKIIQKKDKIVLYTPNAEKVLADSMKILASMKEKILDLHVHKPTMEEVFEVITKR